MSHLKAVTHWLSTGFSGFLRGGERSYSWMLFMGCLQWLAARCQCCLPLREKIKLKKISQKPTQHCCKTGSAIKAVGSCE